MLALIKREIEDAIIFFAITAVFITIVVSVLVYKVAREGWGDHVFGIPSIMYRSLGSFIYLFFVAAILGALQMNLDKDKKISSFLATLATTRRRILAAKMITGIIWILLVILPVAIADWVLLKIFPRVVISDAAFLRNLFVAVFLCSLACYSFGLQIGWCAKKIWPALGVIFVTPVLVSLIVIKGLDIQTMAILLLFTIAAITRTWQKFMSTPL